MALPINPQSKLVSSISSALGQTAADVRAASPSISNAISKSSLDSKINSLAGGVGSGLNGATSGLNDAVASIGNLGSGDSFNNIISTVTGNNNISSLADNIGTTATSISDISGTLNSITGGGLAGGLLDLAGAIAKGAGVLSDILSLKRGANIPPGAELYETQGEAIKLNPGSKDDWRVRISCDWRIFNSPLFDRLEETGGVVWPYMPNINFSTRANYDDSGKTIHNNYPFYAYQNSQVEDIQISGEFSAETETDAAYWIAATTFFRTATKMFFGQGENAGNPPIICLLNGYGSSIFNNVPVIVKSFSVELEDGVNYVRCNTFGTNTWVPIMSNISVTVAPVYNRRNLRQFSLEQFASGKLVSPSGVGYL